MKGILVVLDGMGDLPNKLLEDMTPLEAANTPNMDFFASRGELGYMYPIRQGFVPGSDEAIVSLFGNDLSENSRGQLEARGTNVKLMRGDLALRVNFATIDNIKSGKILDRRVGRTLTTKEAEILSKSLNKIELPVKFEFIPTIQHRAVLVLKGGFSDSVTVNDLTHVNGKMNEQDKVVLCKPKDDDETSHYTVNILNEFLDKSYNVLESHPVNQDRRKRGLLPANYLFLRGPGIDKPKLNQYKKWLSIAYMPLEIGFSRTSGMEVFSFDYPKLKGIDSYENLWEGLEKACEFSIKTLKKQHEKFDYAYIHIKETDLPGHDNKPVEKKLMLEHIDQTLFNFLREFAPPNKIKIAVTADHSTPCKLKAHSDDFVPVLLYDFQIPRERHFSEREARNGSLGKIDGKEFLSRIGFDK